MKKVLYISVLIILLVGCNGTSLDREYSEVNFNALPEEVQCAYLEVMETGEPWYDHYTISLDTEVKRILHEDKSIVGVAPGKKVFNINGKKFNLKWNSNSSSPPYMLHNKVFYFLYMDVYSNQDIGEDNSHLIFRRVDLSSHLDY